ncbi:hypothetical protein L7F22_031776 [Adiantum nelumboides]|nr:hypothetical protein [Adiantum nelumboides]
MASSSESGNLLHIRKLEGAHNFAIWKKQCYNVMLQKKQAKPIKIEGRKPDEIEDEEWEEMDELARSTIMLSVFDSLLFNVENEKSAWGMWKRVFHENSALKISSDKLVLDFKGVPVQFKHLDFHFSLLGELFVVESCLPKRQQNKSFQGWVDLGLKVDMPLPFSMMPDAILTPVGNGILDRILGAMESALLGGLLRDYKQWCRKQSEQLSPSSPEAATYENLVSS